MINTTESNILATPAAKVISEFKGVRAVARALDLNPSSVSRWTAPKEKRGLGGRVPSIHQAKILQIARERGLDLTAADLIHGAE